MSSGTDSQKRKKVGTESSRKMTFVATPCLLCNIDGLQLLCSVEGPQGNSADTSRPNIMAAEVMGK